jgi:hypothetical protein
MVPSLKTYVGASIVGACICAAMVRSAPRRMPMRKAPTPDEAHVIYNDATAREPEERLKSKGAFPSSPWSQDDDFHNKEMKAVKDYARSHRVSVGNVLDALDTGMRAHWETTATNIPSPKVMPCRPRLSY